MAKTIMVQGTMSNAGKSLIAAGLCRIFVQDGYKTAPFKSQNMALNSFITKEGLEMGRAQAVQAQAANIEPSVLMNPILLKPTNDVGSQVIVNGDVRGNMPAREYFKYKKNLVGDIMTAFNKLSEEYDIIVIEGAGSPAEINLKSFDIVNMGMAKMADAPVILVGDIDRGGVFAQLVGTVMLLEQEEKSRIKGLVINKFRGDKTILDPGVEMLEERINIPVVGVVPYMQVDIEDEDSLSERLTAHKRADLVDIAVIRLPRISNFTDFDVLENIEDVSLRYVSSVKDFGNPDMIILPGSKSTVQDLIWLRESGLESMIFKAYNKGKLIFGICGGYQMLGEVIEDEKCVETEIKKIKGLGLLPITTFFEGEKRRTRVTGKVENLKGIFEELSGAQIEGYEIHMGVSGLKSGENFLTIKNINSHQEIKDGCVYKNVCGTYIHGIFDLEGIRDGIIDILFKAKGIERTKSSMDIKAYRQQQFDKLAEELRKSLDMHKIYEILGLDKK